GLSQAYRNTIIWGSAGEYRTSFRTGLQRSTSSPEGHGRSALRSDPTGNAGENGGSGHSPGSGDGLLQQWHGRISHGSGSEFLFSGDEYPFAGGASRHRDDHRY